MNRRWIATIVASAIRHPARSSRDEGETWSEPVRVVDFVGDGGYPSSVLGERGPCDHNLQKSSYLVRLLLAYHASPIMPRPQIREVEGSGMTVPVPKVNWLGSSAPRLIRGS